MPADDTRNCLPHILAPCLFDVCPTPIRGMGSEDEENVSDQDLQGDLGLIVSGSEMQRRVIVCANEREIYEFPCRTDHTRTFSRSLVSLLLGLLSTGSWQTKPSGSMFWGNTKSPATKACKAKPSNERAWEPVTHTCSSEPAGSELLQHHNGNSDKQGCNNQ